MSPVIGIPKSDEHKEKIRLSNILTRLSWSPEKKEEMRKKNSDGHKGVGLGKKLPPRKDEPWNKGNNWRNKHTPEEVRAITAERARKYRENNPRVRVDGRVSAMIRQALKAKKSGKSWESLVGYTTEQLCDHLEGLFQDGMSWENIGEWHIDHIRPRSSFHYEDANDPEFLECWSLSNLQPLWAKDNLVKGRKW